MHMLDKCEHGLIIDDIGIGFHFDDCKFIAILTRCRTYEELRVQCDLNQCECIMTKEEFDSCKSDSGFCANTNGLTSLYYEA